MFKLFLKISIGFVLFLGLQRLAFLITFHSQFFTAWSSSSAPIEDICAVFLAGIRFDFLVAGYCLLPAFILLTINLLTKLRFSTLLLTLAKALTGIAIVFITTIGCMDFFWFKFFQNRFDSANTFASLRHLLVVNSFFILILFFHILFLLFWLRRFLKTHFHQARVTHVFEWTLVFIYLTLIIRGSISEHHLDLRDSEVTQSKFFNQASISSAYALDQALRKRR